MPWGKVNKEEDSKAGIPEEFPGKEGEGLIGG
jgi:hypothetical protein